MIRTLAALVLSLIRRGAPNVEQRDLFSVPGGPLVLERTNRSGTRRRAVLRPPGGPATVLPMPSGADLHNLAVAGALAAVATRRHIVLLELPSGAERGRLPLGDFARAPLLALGVSESGDVALIAEDGAGRGVVGWAPAGAAEPGRIRCIATPGRRCRIDQRVYGSRLQRLARRVVTIPRGRVRKIRVPVGAELFITTARVIDPDAITF